MKIPVSCVEAGRWAVRSAKFASSPPMPKVVRSYALDAVDLHAEPKSGKTENESPEHFLASRCISETGAIRGHREGLDRDLAPLPASTAPLTGSFERCYVPEVALLAGVAKLGYAADSKSLVCFFCPLRNASQLLESKQENADDARPPFAGIFEHFEGF